MAWATWAENADHRWAHGTMICGEAIPHSVLTQADVLAIREKRAGGAVFRVIAAEYGVAIQTIQKIVRGERWKHITDPNVASRAKPPA